MLDSNTAGSMPKQNVFNKIVTFSWVKKSIVVEVICILFILLFIYAAVSKLMDYQKFRAEIGQSPILTVFGRWVVVIIPSVEILISILLLTTKFRLIGLYASLTLMVIFSTYIIVLTKFSEYVPCSCGGVLKNLTWHQHLIFNIAFIVLGLINIILFDKPHTTSLKHKLSL